MCAADGSPRERRKLDCSILAGLVEQEPPGKRRKLDCSILDGLVEQEPPAGFTLQRNDGGAERE